MSRVKFRTDIAYGVSRIMLLKHGFIVQWSGGGGTVASECTIIDTGITNLNQILSRRKR